MERMILAGRKEDDRFSYQMRELEKLAEAAGAEVVGILTQENGTTDPKTYLGSGKVEELSEMTRALEADAVVFLSSLSGSKIRNLEDALGVKVLDRTMLILDIFASRATTNEGVLEVKLAQLGYRLPRLAGLGGSLSRTGGGIGTRGPGEQKLETDRRHILREMDRIKKKLKAMKKHRDTLERARERSALPRIALFGYTNAGKSTILNAILKESMNPKTVLAKDMLFASLETRMRRAMFPEGAPFLISDTVGIVSDLGTEFVEAFQSTLEDMKNADLVLHVVDLSSPYHIEEEVAGEEILNRYEKTDVLTVYNKKDLITEEMLRFPEGERKITISAKDPGEILRLLRKVESMTDPVREHTLLIPHEKAHLIYERGLTILSEEHLAEGVCMTVRAGERFLGALTQYEVDA